MENWWEWWLSFSSSFFLAVSFSSLVMVIFAAVLKKVRMVDEHIGMEEEGK